MIVPTAAAALQCRKVSLNYASFNKGIRRGLRIRESITDPQERLRPGCDLPSGELPGESIFGIYTART